MNVQGSFLKNSAVQVAIYLTLLGGLGKSALGQTADSFNATADSTVLAMIQQTDGEIAVAGIFTTLDGQTRNRMGRVSSAGTLDALNAKVGTFGSSQVNCISIQSDGKLLIGGTFLTLGGKSRIAIGRVNGDGTLDTAFSGVQGGYTLGVNSIGIQSDGKIVAAGGFVQTAGTSLTNLARFNPDGTFDTQFAATVDGVVRSMVFQPDGKFVLAGDFKTVDGQPRSGLARLNPDGTLDTSFNTETNVGVIYCLSIQADGKVLVGGVFTNLCGQSRSYIGRLNSDGSLDATFNPGIGPRTVHTAVLSMALQADGKILLGGNFTNVGTLRRTNLARLNADGSTDTNFNAMIGPSGSVVNSLGIQSDGKILVGGYFASLAGQDGQCLGRLNNTDAATQSLAFDGSSIIWLRGGAAPEIWSAGFDASLDGLNWSSLGTGKRIPGGWQLTGAPVSTNAIIRARGMVNGGFSNGSTWFVESFWPRSPTVRPEIVVSDSGFGLHSNAYSFHFTTGTSQSSVIEGSTNFINWDSLVTNGASNNPLYFTDPQPTNSFRFYRIRAQ